MLITEFFSSALEASLRELSKGNVTDFLPDFHTSLPEFQDNLFYLCADAVRELRQPDVFAFQNVEGFLFLYTKFGQGMLTTDGESLMLVPGSLLLWDCQDYLQLKAVTPSWTVELVFFCGKSAQLYYEELCKLRFPLFLLPQNSAILDDLQHLQLLGAKTTPHHAFLENKLITNILSDLLFSIHREEISDKPIPPYLREIKKLFDTNFGDVLSIEDLSSSFHVNRYRLSREFSEFYGKTPIKYLNDVRINNARRLLETTDLRVHEVGSAVGIDNTTHFIRLFKEKTGTTPASYRSSCQSFYGTD